MQSVTLKTARAESTMYVLGTMLGVLLFSLALFAQANFGRILGTVTDQSGAVLQGATVNIIDTERGLARTLTTDAAGEYNAPTLTPGTYTVRVEANGFKALDRRNVVLEVGREVRVDLTPQPGSQTQTVTVAELIPLVDTSSATLGGTVNNADINDLPLNGRNYQSLLALRPGVMIQAGGSPWTQSTNNVRPDETAWMLDGVFNANFYDARPVANMPSPFTDAATILPIDAIQEFNLEENPKAEFGWKPGAVVNVGIRSGTNTLHGSAYAFGRDVNWDARNLFNPPPQEKVPTELEQFGGVVGGHIKKDQLFFFAGYEGLRSTVGNAFGTSVPEIAGQPTADPKHSLVDAITDLQKAGVTPSPVSLKLAGCTLGPTSCTGGLYQGASPTTASYTSSFPNSNVSDNGIGKIDYRINAKHMINGMVWTGDYKGNGEDHPLPNQVFTSPILIRTWTVATNWIWTPSSRLVNEVRFGLNRATFILGVNDINVLADGKGYPINTGATLGGLPIITVSGFAQLGGWRNRPNSFGPSPDYHYQDSVSYLLGRHNFKFGGEFAHIHVDTSNGGAGRGQIDFKGGKTSQILNSTPLEDFLAGNPTQGSILVGNPVRIMTWTSTSAFVQDDWRITPKLMLNLGLRYEYKSPIKEINNLWGNFDPKLGLVQQGQPSVGDSLWKPDRKNFSPRAGFAWDITGKGTTVVRGGASIIYTTLVAAIFMNQQGLQNTTSNNVGANPTGACTSVVPIGAPCPKTFGGNIQLGNAAFSGSSLNWNGVVFPAGGGLACTKGSQCNLFGLDPNLKTPYVVNYNFGVQHAFNGNLSLEVGYVGTHGDNLLGLSDINQIDPATGVRPYAAAFPYLKWINYVSNYGRSNYNSLQTTLTKRVSHGLSFTAGYTYGHGLDNGSLNRYGYLPQNSQNPNAEYSSGDFDIRHRVTLTATYALPGKKGFGQLLEGWKINSIVNLQSPQPWNITDSSNDFSGSGDTTDRWNFYGNPGDFRSGSSSLPYCTGPGANGCSVTSGVSGIQTFFSPSTSTAMWGQCTAVAPDPDTLLAGGCFVSGKSVMTPPKNGTFGTMGRNLFRDSGFKSWDLSVFKDFRFKERVGVQFRAEFFNVLNHPAIANPYGSVTGGSGGNDPSAGNLFGCGCGTPDGTAGNPIIGSGSARDIQIGLKLTF
jgi:hypothetical protein